MNDGNYAPQHNGGGGGLLWLLLLLGVFFGVMLAGGTRGGTQETLSGNLAENQLMSGNRADLLSGNDVYLFSRCIGDYACASITTTVQTIDSARANVQVDTAGMLPMCWDPALSTWTSSACQTGGQP